MTMVGHGIATVNTVSPNGRDSLSKNGNYMVQRLTDPTDAAAAIVGSICIAHDRGVDGIAFSPAEARALAALLVHAAGECEELIAAKRAVSS